MLVVQPVPIAFREKVVCLPGCAVRMSFIWLIKFIRLFVHNIGDTKPYQYLFECFIFSGSCTGSSDCISGEGCLSSGICGTYIYELG